jgi:hypothetical protein
MARFEKAFQPAPNPAPPPPVGTMINIHRSEWVANLPQDPGGLGRSSTKLVPEAAVVVAIRRSAHSSTQTADLLVFQADGSTRLETDVHCSAVPEAGHLSAIGAVRRNEFGSPIEMRRTS